MLEYVFAEQSLQPVLFKGAVPAGHSEQIKASLILENPVLLQFKQMPLACEAVWKTKKPGIHNGLNVTVNMLLSKANVVDAAVKLTLRLEKNDDDFKSSKNEGIKHLLVKTSA